MSYPQPPDKVTAFNSARPATSPEIGLQFTEHTRSIKDVIAFLRHVVRDDGTLKNGVVSLEALDPQLTQMVAQTAMRAVEDMLVEVNVAIASVRASAYEAGRAAERAERAAIGISAALGEATRINADTAAQARTMSIQALSAPVALSSNDPNDGVTPSSFLNQMSLLDGTTAGAQDWAEASMDWAEHMPDIIPGKTRGIMALTGDHWSSRWWATRAQGAFGMQAMWYQGAFGDPGPPTTPLTSTGDPIPPGAMYWNTDHNQMMAWDGVAWAAIGVPAAATSSSLFYEATDGQTDFATTDTDINGQSFELRPDGSNGVNVFLNGVRLTFVRDYDVDAATSTIVLAYPAIGGSILGLDVLVPQADIAPGGVSIHKCRTLNPFDGTTTVFQLQTLDGAQLVLGGSNELLVVLDGVQQEPGVDYAASGSSITFSVAPAADVKTFILWYTPVTEPGP